MAWLPWLTLTASYPAAGGKEDPISHAKWLAGEAAIETSGTTLKSGGDIVVAVLAAYEAGVQAGLRALKPDDVVRRKVSPDRIKSAKQTARSEGALLIQDRLKRAVRERQEGAKLVETMGYAILDGVRVAVDSYVKELRG